MFENENSTGKCLLNLCFLRLQDLRDEKDKRQRAENQVKQIKEELKMCKIEHQRISDSKILQLQDVRSNVRNKLC